MPTRSFTVGHIVWDGPGQRELWPRNSGYTVLIKSMFIHKASAGDGTMTLLCESPAGTYGAVNTVVTQYQARHVDLWLALSPDCGASLTTAEGGRWSVFVSGTLLPAGPGLGRAATLPSIPERPVVTPIR